MKRYCRSMILFTLGILLLSFFNNVHAVNETTDCQETARDSEDLFPQTVVREYALFHPGKELQIFTDKDLKMALHHIQQYCCQENINEDDCTGKLDGKHYFAESPYLIDHLVTIGMRKLDGIQEHCDEIGIDCIARNGKVLAKEWRQKVTKFAEDVDGGPPGELYELFKKYRGDEKTFADESQSNLIANAYYAMCDEAVQIKKATTLGQKGTINQDSAWLQNCYSLVADRYKQESEYVKTLMVDRGVMYLKKNMQAYLKKYFIDNRMNALIDKFAALDACYGMVLKYVTRTSCCVQ